MLASVSRRSRSSSSSSSRALSLRNGTQEVANARSLVSIRGRAPSVNGGAGGLGTRNAQSSCSSDPTLAVVASEKLTMQNLNGRLSSYLQTVRSLEGANRKLELQISEHCGRQTGAGPSDFSRYSGAIDELRAQVSRKQAENQSIILRIDNARLAAQDFTEKYETEQNFRALAEADARCLRGVRDSLTLAVSDLETQVEELKEELISQTLSHEEEMRELKIRQNGAVNVEVDSAQSAELTEVLQGVREQYERVVRKKTLEVERWFQSKVESLQTQIVTHETEAKTSHTELSGVKNTYQGLEIKLQSSLCEVQRLQRGEEEVHGRFGARLGQLQATINALESELQQLRAAVEAQQSEYSLLLDIKMRLELEIAQYRRLLGGEHEEKTTVVIGEVVEEKEARKRHMERRLRVITEQLVDGVIVSSTSDTTVEEIQ